MLDLPPPPPRRRVSRANSYNDASQGPTRGLALTFLEESSFRRAVMLLSSSSTSTAAEDVSLARSAFRLAAACSPRPPKNRHVNEDGERNHKHGRARSKPVEGTEGTEGSGGGGVFN